MPIVYERGRNQGSPPRLKANVSRQVATTERPILYSPDGISFDGTLDPNGGS